MSYSKKSMRSRKISRRRKRSNTRRKRGGDSAQDKHRAEQISHGIKKQEKNMIEIDKNKKLGLYTPIELEGPNSYFAINGLEISPKERQQLLRDGKTTYVDMHAFNKATFSDPMTYEEMDEDGLTFGGKRRRKRKGRKTKKRKHTRKKNARPH
jgi:hypothetical protein